MAMGLAGMAMGLAEMAIWWGAGNGDKVVAGDDGRIGREWTGIAGLTMGLAATDGNNPHQGGSPIALSQRERVG